MGTGAGGCGGTPSRSSRSLGPHTPPSRAFLLFCSKGWCEGGVVGMGPPWEPLIIRSLPPQRVKVGRPQVRFKAQRVKGLSLVQVSGSWDNTVPSEPEKPSRLVASCQHQVPGTTCKIHFETQFSRLFFNLPPPPWPRALLSQCTNGDPETGQGGRALPRPDLVQDPGLMGSHRSYDFLLFGT